MGPLFGLLKSSRPLQLPAPAKAQPFVRRADCAAPNARDAQAAKQDARQSNVRAASVQGHPPVHQLTDNGRVGRVPNLSLIHISEPTRLLSISYAVFCLKKK